MIFLAGAPPDPAEGAYSAPPDPLAGFKGPLLGREGKGRKEKGKGYGDRGNKSDGTGHGMGRGGKGRERRKGREREEGLQPQTSLPGAATANTVPDPNQVATN